MSVYNFETPRNIQSVYTWENIYLKEYWVSKIFVIWSMIYLIGSFACYAQISISSASNILSWWKFDTNDQHLFLDINCTIIMHNRVARYSNILFSWLLLFDHVQFLSPPSHISNPFSLLIFVELHAIKIKSPLQFLWMLNIYVPASAYALLSISNTMTEKLHLKTIIITVYYSIHTLSFL